MSYSTYILLPRYVLYSWLSDFLGIWLIYPFSKITNRIKDMRMFKFRSDPKYDPVGGVMHVNIFGLCQNLIFLTGYVVVM